MPTTNIDPDADVATQINVFTVAPERQRELVRALREATEQVMRHQPGFVSANLHASEDGTRVVNYAQWASEADFTAMLSNPACQEHMSAAADIATAYDPHLHTVESTHHA